MPKFTLKFISVVTICSTFNMATGFTQEVLVPTTVNTGDCVSKMSISTTKPDKVTFFTDRCSGNNYYIAINGVEYQLKHTGGSLSSRPYRLGSFSGKDIRVSIERIGLIRKSYEEGIESGYGKVLVRIIKSKSNRKIIGVLDYGGF